MGNLLKLLITFALISSITLVVVLVQMKGLFDPLALAAITASLSLSVAAVSAWAGYWSAFTSHENSQPLIVASFVPLYIDGSGFVRIRNLGSNVAENVHVSARIEDEDDFVLSDVHVANVLPGDVLDWEAKGYSPHSKRNLIVEVSWLSGNTRRDIRRYTIAPEQINASQMARFAERDTETTREIRSGFQDIRRTLEEQGKQAEREIRRLTSRF